MESINELKQIDIKNPACYYFDDITNGADNYMKIFQFMTFRIKLQQVHNHCVLGSIK